MSSSSWWAQKLGTPTPPSTPPYQQPSQQPVLPVQQQQQPVYQPSRVPQRSNSNCPGCGSGNYGQMTPETRARCYDCGYPLVQQGSGMTVGQGSSGPTRAARQAAGGGFNPGTIIDRIG